VIQGRTTGFKKTKRLYVVSTEGSETEPIYFQEFRPGRDSAFRLKILGNPKHKTQPVDVVQRLIDYQVREAPGRNTEYWAIMDRNDWTEADLRSAYALANHRRDFHIAMSFPCFELWLWLHLRPNRPFSDRHACQRQLEREWFQFSKSAYPAAELMPYVSTACSRAQEITESVNGLLRSQGTQVFELVRRLSS
jgi:hypothetical protein